jgi:formylglycine-generating enzyme required for sulfatase activity
MKNKLHRILSAAVILLLFSGNLQASNITIANVSLTGADIVNNTIMVQFDLSWENSWRVSTGPANWDAAWVFVKYRITVANGGDGLWKHAWLNNAGHNGGTGTGTNIDPGLRTPGSAFNATTNPALGAFVYRSGPGSGTFSAAAMQLRWNYGANGVADNSSVDIQVFAIEMVYVPQGAFAAGSGGAETSRFALTTINTSNATLPTTGIIGSLGGQAGGYPRYETAPANATWPNGFSAFYCMKYEISQQQYVDFLNTLTRAQQNSRTGTSLAAGTTSVTNRYVMSNTSSISYRNGIRCDATIHTSDPITFYCDLSGNGTGGEAGDGQWIACNFLSWMDGAAYSDWAGLRPMTELEFEKACRGTIAPVANEYAWGNTSATAATGISNGGLATETPSNSGANAACNYSFTGGPLRVGAFATGSSSRAQAGASYWGIMEMSGNLWERSVTIGNIAGRSYKGIHGNGALNSAGAADEDHWPGINGNTSNTTANGTYSGTTGVTHAAGSGSRGGNWVNDATYIRVSARHDAAFTSIDRPYVSGFRAVRVP